MVVALRRGPHDPELSPFLAYRNHIHPALHRVQDAVSQSPQTDWSVPAMAAVAHTSPRHLTRLFLEYAQIAPLQYLRRIRLAVALGCCANGAGVRRQRDRSSSGCWLQFRYPTAPRLATFCRAGNAVAAGRSGHGLSCSAHRTGWRMPLGVSRSRIMCRFSNRAPPCS
jgi:hypothetical protein